MGRSNRTRRARGRKPQRDAADAPLRTRRTGTGAAASWRRRDQFAYCRHAPVPRTGNGTAAARALCHAQGRTRMARPGRPAGGAAAARLRGKRDSIARRIQRIGLLAPRPRTRNRSWPVTGPAEAYALQFAGDWRGAAAAGRRSAPPTIEPSHLSRVMKAHSARHSPSLTGWVLRPSPGTCAS